MIVVEGERKCFLDYVDVDECVKSYSIMCMKMRVLTLMLRDAIGVCHKGCRWNASSQHVK